ncbi:unnamed protein product [Protopolystoma xenopodis]|uniref:Uncharacterized protein n=1 Tax=Protopolystoma xenopodis TaxID=117903 RepID=A0A3S5B5L5_9PLAT|nr:unnamed protein product [Protopolystoma xenopodis]
MILCFDCACHTTDGSSAHFHRNRKREYCQQECLSKANRQLVKRNPSSSSGGMDLQISSAKAITRNDGKEIASRSQRNNRKLRKDVFGEPNQGKLNNHNI